MLGHLTDIKSRLLEQHSQWKKDHPNEDDGSEHSTPPTRKGKILQWGGSLETNGDPQEHTRQRTPQPSPNLYPLGPRPPHVQRSVVPMPISGDTEVRRNAAVAAARLAAVGGTVAPVAARGPSMPEHLYLDKQQGGLRQGEDEISRRRERARPAQDAIAARQQEAGGAEGKIRQTITPTPLPPSSFPRFLQPTPVIMPLPLERPSKYEDSSSDSESSRDWPQTYGKQTHTVQYPKPPTRAATMTNMPALPPPSLSNLVSLSAAYDSQERNRAPRCLPGTRRSILDKIDVWVNAGPMGSPILWLHGPAGAGKSTIAQTVAEKCAERYQLAASFLFARTVHGRSTIQHLFPTIAFQIALLAPERYHKLERILNNDPYIARRSLIDLIVSLCQDDSQDPLAPSSPFLVIIDGVDECQGHDNQRGIVAHISDLVLTHRLPLRFLIVSRTEFYLCEAFEEPSMAGITEILDLHGDVLARVDISTYLQNEFSRIYHSKRHRNVMESVPSPWPSEDTIQRLVIQSGGCFIYASTVIRFIDNDGFSPPEQLGQVLNHDCEPFAELDKLYMQILSSYPRSDLPILKGILGHVLFHSGPCTVEHIAAFHRLSPRKMKLMMRGLQSLVTFNLRGLELTHLPFREFLLDKARAKAHYIDREEWYMSCDGSGGLPSEPLPPPPLADVQNAFGRPYGSEEPPDVPTLSEQEADSTSSESHIPRQDNRTVERAEEERKKNGGR